MKLIQITDLHIGLEGQNTKEVDVRANFLEVLKEVKKEQADHLIITGDFCYRDPMLEIYEWIYPILENVGIPYSMVPGNHDDNSMLSKSMGTKLNSKTNEIFFSAKFKQWDALFLDTGPATMSYDQFEWFQSKLNEMDGDCLIFMHHPPIHCNTPFMDNEHSFKQSESFIDCLSLFTYQAHIFCGHYHIHKEVSLGNINLHVTPSLLFQIKQSSSEFEIDHYNVGYRVIELEEDRIYSSLHYLPGNKI